MLGVGGVQVEGHPIHKDCFRCVDCKELIVGGYQHKKNLVEPEKKEHVAETEFLCGECAKHFHGRQEDKRKKKKKGGKEAGKGRRECRGGRWSSGRQFVCSSV